MCDLFLPPGIKELNFYFFNYNRKTAIRYQRIVTKCNVSFFLIIIFVLHSQENGRFFRTEKQNVIKSSLQESV